MAAYMYPVKVERKRLKVSEQHRVVLDGPLTVTRLAEIVGTHEFGIYEEEDVPFSSGWVIRWDTERPETDEEMTARIEKGEKYNNARHEFQKLHGLLK